MLVFTELAVSVCGKGAACGKWNPVRIRMYFIWLFMIYFFFSWYIFFLKFFQLFPPSFLTLKRLGRGFELEKGLGLYNLVPRAMPVRGLGRHNWLWGNRQPEPLNLGVPVVCRHAVLINVKPITAQEKLYFPKANAIFNSPRTGIALGTRLGVIGIGLSYKNSTSHYFASSLLNSRLPAV